MFHPYKVNIENLLGNAHQALNRGEYGHALTFCRQAVALDATNATAQSNLSYLAFLNGDLHEALMAGALAVKHDPVSTDARINYANALRTNGETDLATKHLEEALKVDNQNAIIWTQLNLAYQDLGRIADAIDAGNTAIQLDTKMPHAYNNLALSYQQLGMIEKADALLRRALQLNPEVEFLHKNLLMNLQYLPGISSAQMRSAALEYSDRVLSYPQPHPFTPAPEGEVIRVGFVSGDFRQHPVGYFLLSVIRAINPDRLQVFLYANQQIEDELTKQLKSHCHRWVNIQQMDDPTASAQIRHDQIDILVDLSGHTSGSRLHIFSARSAPVQLSWLGYFATTGVDEMDYVLLGSSQVGEGTSCYFTEKNVMLPGTQFCYTPPNRSPQTQSPPNEKNGFVTFGCFNNTAKLNADVIRTWSRILLEIQDSKLILKWSAFDDEQAQGHFINQFALNGIEQDRLEFRGKSPHEEMLNQYNDIDIALDPFPFSGALTTCEALWMGLPVITMAQLRPVSRQTAGLLSNLNMEELVAATENEYIKIAKNLATDKERIRGYRMQLRGAMNNSPITDGNKMAQELESVFLGLLGGQNSAAPASQS